MRFYFWTALLLALALTTGCSGGKNVPTLPYGTDADAGLASVFDEPQTIISSDDSHNWSVIFEGEFVPDGNGGLQLIEKRDSLANFNITKYVKGWHALHYQIVSWVGNRLELDVTLDNPTAISVYDVRIIFNDIGANKVLNPDSYTMQFSRKINPYISYAKDDPFRAFPVGPDVSDTQRIIFEINGSGVGFTIIASLPWWCEEPYEIHNINLIGELNDEDGGWATLSCIVEDHDWNLEYIAADLRVFTGSIKYMVPNPEQPDHFEVYFTNSELAIGGKSYFTWIVAKSLGSTFLCYNLVEIPVTGGLDPPIVTITVPDTDPYETSDRFTTVAGITENFEGNSAVIDVNGDEQIIPVTNNQFAEAVVLNVGGNFVKVSVEGPGGLGTDTVTINCTAHSANLWVRLTWDKDFADVDMYVTEPSGETCWYGDQISQSTGARIDLDDVDGYGPEHYYLSTGEGHTLLPGLYQLDVHYYYRHSQTQPVLATMLVYKADEYYGEWSHMMVYDNPSQAGPSNRRRGLSSWWDYVADIQMP